MRPRLIRPNRGLQETMDEVEATEEKAVANLVIAQAEAVTDDVMVEEGVTVVARRC